MADSQSRIEIRRIFKRAADGDTAVRLQLACGDQTANVKIDSKKNPRFLKFVVDNAGVIPVETPAKEDDSS